ncbi:hypothetical protein B0H12DRAFT_823776 [Mycena haematopus]|nr:hypothetical protein B0H12DRAFT_823776 [Mycena haematopus]
MPAPYTVERAGSPVSPARTTRIRMLTKLLRPTRVPRALTQPAPFSIPGPNADTRSPSSSPSLYSLSSDSDSRSNLLSVSDRPLLSPTSNTSSSSASEGRGEDITAKDGIDYNASDLDDAPEPISPSEPSLGSPSGDYSPATNQAYGVRPQRIIVADKHDESIDNDDTVSLRAARNCNARTKLQPLSPSEWLGSKVQAETAFGGVSPRSPLESGNRRPFPASLSSSPATPRPSETNPLYAKLEGSDLDIPRRRRHTTPEIPDSELLTETRRRPRSASEPRSFLSMGSAMRHTGTVASTLTEYILSIPPELDTGPKSSQTILPPPRQSSLPSPVTMPDDVYFTAAGRRESRMYYRPDIAPNYVSASPMRRGHTHSSSEPVLSQVDADQRPLSRYATWTRKKSDPTSGRPFEDLIRAATPVGGDSTPVSSDWSGNWNRDDIQDVIRELRSLK